MPKLTLKTTKEGQKCVLTTKTPLFHDYKRVDLPWDKSDDARNRMVEKIPELLALPFRSKKNDKRIWFHKICFR